MLYPSVVLEVGPCRFPLQLFSSQGYGPSNFSLISIPGLPPGSLRYTSGVRGSLQRRTRRGPGRRRRQLQPDACRVLHHRSAGDFLLPTSPIPPFPSFIPAQLPFYCSSPSRFGPVFYRMELFWALFFPSLSSLPFQLSKTSSRFQWFCGLVSLA